MIVADGRLSKTRQLMMGRSLTVAVTVNAVGQSFEGMLPTQGLGVRILPARNFDTSVALTISRKQLINNVPWTQDSEHPPLSARDALRSVAEFRKQRLVERTGSTWVLESLKLEILDLDKEMWCWLAELHLELKGSYSMVPPTIFVAVLMDGTRIEPRATVRSDGRIGVSNLLHPPKSF